MVSSFAYFGRRISQSLLLLLFSSSERISSDIASEMAKNIHRIINGAKSNAKGFVTDVAPTISEWSEVWKEKKGKNMNEKNKNENIFTREWVSASTYIKILTNPHTRPFFSSKFNVEKLCSKLQPLNSIVDIENKYYFFIFLNKKVSKV